MDEKKKEPQSYGSGEQWVRGDTGQTVNRLKGTPNSQNADFYASRHEQDDQSTPRTAPEPAENDGGADFGAREREGSGSAQNPVQKVTAKDSGAKRESYWKERDYKD